MKQKYQITLNRSGQVLVYYKYAHSSVQALALGVRELEKACGLRSGSLTNTFNNNSNNWEVKLWTKK